MKPDLTKTETMCREALSKMNERCDGAQRQDGVGFNGWDRKFVDDIIDRNWTIRMVGAVHKMLKKYRGQLADLGIDYEQIPPVPLSAMAPNPGYNPPGPPSQPAQERKVTLTRVDQKIAITFPFVKELVDAVKRIDGREWDGNGRRWMVPLTPKAIEDLGVFLEFANHNMPVDQAAGLAEELQKFGKEARDMQDASMAASADFHVEGLGGELRPFQRAGVAYASKVRRCFIADEMGLGKTVQALATVQHLQAYPALVVCPASLKINWLRESNKWLRGRHAQVLPSFFKADVDVTNYESIGKLKGHILARGYKSIIFDECHYLKNHKALRTKHALEIVTGIDVRLALSGTPLVNRPAELLAQLDVIGQLEAVGGKQRFLKRFLRYSYASTGTNLDELQREMRAKCFIRRKKADVLTELPPKQRQFVEMPLASRAAYDSAADGCDETLAAIQLFRHEAARQKLPAVIEWVKEFLETGEKLVLFAVHIDIQDALVKAFPGCAKIQGEDQVSVRQQAVDRFQTDPQCKLVVCSLKAAGVGLTLTAASNVAFVEQGWTPGDMDQAEDRCHRIGQRDNVMAWYLVSTVTIDADMAELISKKRESIALATDAEKAKIETSIMGDLLKKYAGKYAKKEEKTATT